MNDVVNELVDILEDHEKLLKFIGSLDQDKQEVFLKMVFDLKLITRQELYKNDNL